MAELTGQTIHGYEFQKPIGAGGYGMIYEAVETAVDRRVAIKVILPEHASKPEFIANFEAEAKLVAQLEHINIVPLYTYWQDEQGAFLVMRYIRGGTLRQMMLRQGALSLAQSARILSQIADALNAAHEAGVIHRDLKPDNILIDERGNAYLTDFGIAKQINTDNSATDSVKGTFAYLSPEQIQTHPVSPQTDIYALGVMLYEMLAGQHPFYETPVTMMIMKHLQESLPLLQEKRPDVPGEVDDLIQKATEKDPEERFESSPELIQAYRAAVNLSSDLDSSGIHSSVSVSQAKRKKPTSPEERNRTAMLQNVRKFWIEGVFDNSVQDALLLDLEKSDASSQIDNPWDSVVRTPNQRDETLPPDASILDIFERMNGKLLILGEPGSGKTTTLLELARDLLNQADFDTAHPLPVIFNLSSWAERQSTIDEWLVSELSNKYQVPRKVAGQWVENDEMILLLDGLDEVKADARNACIEAINAYRTEHGFVDVVVCSRIHDYEALTGQLRLNGAILIQPLTDEQIDTYLVQLGGVAAVPRQLIATDPELRDLARSPLMLNIITQAYREETGDYLPEDHSLEDRRQHIFMRYVNNTLLRRGKSEYTPEDTKRYLWWMATIMQRDGKMIFHLEDMQRDWTLTERRARKGDLFVGSLVIIPAILTNGLLAWAIATVFGLSFGWILFAFLIQYIIHLASVPIAYNHTINRPLLIALETTVVAIPLAVLLFSSQSLSSALIAFLSLTTYFWIKYQYFDYEWHRYIFYDYRNHLVEQLRLDFSSANLFQALLGFVAMIALAAALFVVVVPDSSFLNIVVATVVSGLMAMGIRYVQTALDASTVEQRTDFKSLVRQLTRNSVIGTLLGVAGILIPIVVLGALLHLSWSTTLVLALGLSLGSVYSTWNNFGGANITLIFLPYWIFGRMGFAPPNMWHFVDYATDLILLRKVGSGYIFIHRYLLEYFAELEEEPQEE